MSAVSAQSWWISGPAYEYGEDDAGYYQPHRNHVVSRSFELGAFKRASLTMAVLGYAQATINGQPLGNVELLGDWTNFTKQVTTRTFDVTELLKPGDNEVKVELGNGWFNPSPLTMFGKYNLRERLAEIGTPSVLLTLVVDGQTVLVSDESWDCHEGQLLFNNVYLGETRDLSSAGGAELPLITQKDMRNLEPSVVEPCRRFAPVVGTDVRELADGSLVVDFHELDTGMIDLRFNAHANQEVVVRYAEELDETGIPSYESSHAGLVGCLVPEGFRIPGGPGAPERAIQTDRIICAEGENHFTNQFTVHSCRYAVIEGLKSEQLLSVELVPVHTDLATAGSIATGNEFYDSMVDAAVRTKLNNVHGLWEDCARERLGYGGDMVALAASNLAAFNCEGLIRKTVRDFRNDQTSAGGVPETAPFMGIGSNGTAYGEGPLLWQLAYPHLVLRAYQFYGSHDLVEQEWPHIKKLVDYLLSWDPSELATHCLGDHGSVQTSESFKTGTPDKELVGWCTIARFARAAARIEEILGLPSSGYDVRYDELREQIRERFAHNDGSWGDGTQTGLAFAADLGLADEAELADRLVAKIAEEDGVLTTGIFGTTLAFDLLNRTGHSDVVEAWLTREEAPSYKAMLASGNKALAEQFEMFLSSYNHAMFSSYLQWFYQGLGGIRVADDARGCDRVEIRPYFSPLTDKVSCSLMTRRGAIRTAWKRDAQGEVTFTYVVPQGIEAKIEVPDGVVVRG
ncbi:MAG: family 78 glycoside hydrolase catalytic domain [Atopobiaceae bacterium]|nr:family 78 glycoside hydrolase catalytic domain [Atopobiaceae bacterium]